MENNQQTQHVCTKAHRVHHVMMQSLVCTIKHGGGEWALTRALILITAIVPLEFRESVCETNASEYEIKQW